MFRWLCRSVALVSLCLVGCGSDGTGGDEGDASAGADTGTLPDVDAATAGDPALPGPWGIHVDDGASAPVGSDTIGLTVCSPAEDGQPITGASPLIMVSPGFQLARAQYLSMCRHLASWGYLTIARDIPGSVFDVPNHQQLADDTSTLIDWALANLSSRIDATRIGLAGHSLGGKVSILTAIIDDRIDVVVGWDPVDAKPPVDNGSPSVTPERMAELTVPLAVVGEVGDKAGGMPCAPAEDNYEQYYEHACGAEAIQVTVDDADHMDWIDDRAGCGFTCSFCVTGATDDAHTREVTRRLTVAFFERHLRSSTAQDSYLSASGIGAGTHFESKTSCP